MSRDGKRKYLNLLKDQTVKLWHESGNKGTKSVYLRRLGFLCATYNVTPRKLRTMKDIERHDFLQRVINDLEGKHKAGGTVESYVKAVRSYLRSRYIKVEDLPVHNARATPTLETESIPTKEELQRILNSKDIRAKVAVSIMAFTGVRPEVLGKDGDGLKVMDFPDLVIDNENGRVDWKNIPALVKVRKELSKKNFHYITFLNAQGCEYVKEYLEQRMQDYPILNSHGKEVGMAPGERLTSQSAILTMKYATQKMNRSQIGDRVDKTRGEHIATTKVRELIKSAITRGGFRWRPYIMRRYFDYNLLLLGTARNEVSRDYVVFWMGHHGGIEAEYTRNKGQIAPDVLNLMRKQYADASEKYLETQYVNTEDAETRRRRNLALRAGIPEKEITPEMLADDDALAGALMGWGLRLSFGRMKQKKIRKDELDEYLEMGYKVAMEVSDGYLINIPEAPDLAGIQGSPRPKK